MPLSVEGGGLQFVASIDNSDFGKNIRQMEEQLRELTQTAQTQSSSMEGFAQKAALAVGSYLSLNAASDFVKQVIDVRSQFQALDISFSTMLKSKEKANALMADVVKLAATTPFTLQQVGEGAKQLLAYGTGAEHVVDTLKMLGDVASGVGAPIGDLVYLYGTLQTQGRAYTRDILQFTSRGIPIIGELAKQFGVTKDKVQDMVEAGKVGFPQVEQAFKSLTGQGGMFFNLMDQQSKTLTGQISNLQDSFSQMLNEIGKSQEGILAGGIGGLKTLVDHYQDVSDILKVIILTYGAYKTAIIVNTALQGIQTQSVLGYTLAEQLRLKAMFLTEGAMKTLNAVMAASPTIALTAGIAAVTAAIYAMSTTSNAAAAALSKIADIQSEAAQAAAKEKATIDELLNVYNDRNKSDAEHAAALQKIIDLNPNYLKGLNANNIATAEGQTIIQNYLKSLEDKAKGEAAYAAKQANLLKIVDLQTKGIGAVDNTERLARSLKNFFTAQSDLSGINEDKAIVQQMIKELQQANSEIDKTFKDQIQKTVVGDTTTNDAAVASQKRTLAVIEAEIKAIKERQTAESVSRQQYIDYQKQITKLEAEAEAIRGASKSQIKDQQKAENELNAILEKRKSILDDLANLHREATQSGLTKEASEVDKINEKYDLAIKKIQEFNAAHPKQQISTVEIQAVGSDRATEVNNAILRQQADDYKKSLDVQKDLFTQYEEAKKTIGIDKANQMFAGQKQDYSSYLDYLKAQQRDILDQASVVGNNVGLTEKLKAVSNDIVATEKANAQTAINETIRVIQATQTYADQRKQIEEKYQRDVAALQKNFTGEDLQKRVGIATAEKEDQLKSLRENLSQQSLLYKNLAEDIDTNFDSVGRKVLEKTRSFLEERKKLIEASLKQGYVIDVRTGEQIPLTKQQIDALNKALKETNNTIGAIKAAPFSEIAKYASTAASSFNELSAAIKPLNEGLGEALGTMGGLASTISTVATSFADFAKGTTEGLLSGITGIVGAASAVIGLIAGQLSHNAQIRAQIDQFNTNILKGEIDINEQYRQRALLQSQINKLRLEGLQAEANTLATNKEKILADYQKIFDALGKESYKTVQTFYELNTQLSLKMANDFVNNGFGTWDEALKKFGVAIQKIVDTPLAGKSFDDMEKLFMSGQLEGKAKELFQTLEKLKQEGLDVDAALAENNRKAAETFAGTTAESIVNSIADGFSQGFKSVQQFATKTEDIIRGAMLNALKYQFLEKPIQALFDQFAKDAQSGGGLDTTEVANFTANINKTIADAAAFTAQIEKATGISLSNATAANADGSNTLQGAMKSMSQQSADLLAGQFGGLRITALEQLDVANKQLLIQNKIEQNTAAAVVVMSDYYRNWSVNGLAVRLQ